MATLDRFTFRLENEDGDILREITPMNDRLELVWEKPNKEFARFWRRILKTPLRFNKADFRWLNENATFCDSFVVVIHRKCAAGGEPFLWHKGRIFMSDCPDRDEERGLAQFPVQPFDIYECFLNRLKTKVNLLDFGTPQTVFNIIGEIQTKTCFEIDPVDPSIPPAACYGAGLPGGIDAGLWTQTYYKFSTSLGGDLTRTDWQWKREKWTLPDALPDNSWTLVNDPLEGPIYVRRIRVQANARYDLTGGDYEIRATIYNFAEQSGVDNGRRIKDIFLSVLNYGTDVCQIEEVVSNYLDINPDGLFPFNDAYERAMAKLKYLTIFQRSDIMKWDADQNATAMRYTIEEFINIHCRIFNLFWTLEDMGEDLVRFRIEHVSQLEQEQQFDLRGKYTRKGNRYQIQGRDDVPEFEEWEMARFRENTRFAPSRITYQGQCVNNDDGKQYIIREASTDFEALIINDDEATDLLGIFFMSVHYLNGTNYIDMENGDFNGALSWWELLRYYWKHERYLLTGVITSASQTDATGMESARRIKQGPQLQLPFLCADEIAFNPMSLQRDDIGYGEVQGASYDTGNEVLTLKLLHDI
jgi:hypothetical protein